MGDIDRDGQLSVREFRAMMVAMGLGLRNARVVQVFESLDTDDSGHVSEQEFIRFLFPDSYHSIYDDAESECSRSVTQESEPQANHNVNEDHDTNQDAESVAESHHDSYAESI